MKHGHSYHPIYSVWRAMINRCYNKKSTYYHNYGGRGVRVCDEWRHDFAAFFNWSIANGWQKGLEIDKDIKGNGMIYSPDTCVFVTRKENGRKKKNNVLVVYNGESKPLAEWCELFNLKYTTIRHRLRSGMEPSNAFTKVKYA